MNLQPTRRTFLSTLGFGGMLGTLGQLRTLAKPEPGAGYKALVCIYLDGGNDAANMLVPGEGGQTTRKLYESARGAMAIKNLAQPDKVISAPVGNSDDTVELGLHPACSPLSTIYERGELAFVCNVGPLTRPLASRADYREYDRPDYLFSHSDMKRDWHTAVASNVFGPSGWGGRLAELTAASSKAYSMNQTSPFLRGKNGKADPYTVLAPGKTLYLANIATIGGNGHHAAVEKMMARRVAKQNLTANPFEVDYARTFESARERKDIIQGIFDGYEAVKGKHPRSGASFTWDDEVHKAFQDVYGYSAKGSKEIGGLGNQLMAIARLIGRQSDLGESRHIFAAGAGQYDTHNDQAGDHADLLAELATALRGFHEALRVLGKSDEVVAFTASDFGRSLLPNKGEGTDHAWGGHALVMGGAVRGGRTFGTFPNYDLSLPDDLNMSTDARGRFIPGIAVSEYCASLSHWFADGDAQAAFELGELFPELKQFPDPLKNPELAFFG